MHTCKSSLIKRHVMLCTIIIITRDQEEFQTTSNDAYNVTGNTAEHEYEVTGDPLPSQPTPGDYELSASFFFTFCVEVYRFLAVALVLQIQQWCRPVSQTNFTRTCKLSQILTA